MEKSVFTEVVVVCHIPIIQCLFYYLNFCFLDLLLQIGNSVGRKWIEKERSQDLCEGEEDVAFWSIELGITSEDFQRAEKD